MQFTNEELFALNDFFNSQEELPPIVSDINERLKAQLYPVVDEPAPVVDEPVVDEPVVDEPAPAAEPAAPVIESMPVEDASAPV